MSKLTRWICLALVTMLLLSVCGCSKDGQPSANKGAKPAVDTEPYIGTWQGTDHDGENVVHYLIFDEKGYWNVYMNYSTLLRAIKQLPDQLVSFKVFCELQKSNHTGCHYEYVEDIEFTEDFAIDASGKMTAVASEDVSFTKVTTHSGEPSSAVVAEARDLFDRALVDANSKAK